MDYAYITPDESVLGLTAFDNETIKELTDLDVDEIELIRKVLK